MCAGVGRWLAGVLHDSIAVGMGELFVCAVRITLLLLVLSVYSIRRTCIGSYRIRYIDHFVEDRALIRPNATLAVHTVSRTRLQCMYTPPTLLVLDFFKYIYCRVSSQLHKTDQEQRYARYINVHINKCGCLLILLMHDGGLVARIQSTTNHTKRVPPRARLLIAVHNRTDKIRFSYSAQ